MKKIYYLVLLSLSALLISSSLFSTDSYTFFEDGQEDLSSLRDNHGWIISHDGYSQSVDIVTKEDGYLHIGGESETPPSVIIPFPKPSKNGSVEIEFGTTASYSGTVMEVLNEQNEVLFHIKVDSPKRLILESTDLYDFTDVTYSGLNMCVFGTHGSSFNRVHLKANWSNGNVKMSVSQPDASNPYVLDDKNLDLGAMQTTGIPSKLKIHTSRHDHNSRWIAIFSINIK